MDVKTALKAARERVPLRLDRPNQDAPMAYAAGHYYSPVASLAEIEKRKDAIFAAPPTLPGIELNADGQLARLPEFEALA